MVDDLRRYRIIMASIFVGLYIAGFAVKAVNADFTIPPEIGAVFVMVATWLFLSAGLRKKNGD